MKSSIVVGACLLMLYGLCAYAQSYPAKPLQFVVSYPAGGGVDLTARIVAAKLSQQIGRPVVIDNRAGAGGTVGAEFVVKSAPDGYTFLVGGTGPLSVAPALYKSLPYSPLKDLAPVILLVTIPQILVVNPALPVRSVQDLIALSRKRPGELNMASGGNGTGQHLAGALFVLMANLKITHIPYKGTTPAVNDVIGGHVEMLFGDPSIIPLIKSGKLRALGVTTGRRYSALPGVVPIKEAGLPEFELTSFYALSVPAATPQNIIARINSEVAKVLADPATKEKLEGNGLIPAGGTPEHLGEFIRKHAAVSARILKDSKASID